MTEVKDWSTYYDQVGEKPNPLVVRALEFTTKRGQALDLGCGNFRDSKFLLAQGFREVMAVDSFNGPRPPLPKGITFTGSRIEHFGMLDDYDFAVCINTLFFINKIEVSEILRRVYDALAPGGVFVFNVLGTKDDWTKERKAGISAYQQSEIYALNGRYPHVHFESNERDGSLANGKPHHWHTYEFVVKKPMDAVVKPRFPATL